MTAGSESDCDSNEPLSDGDLAVRVWRGEMGRDFASVYGTPAHYVSEEEAEMKAKVFRRRPTSCPRLTLIASDRCS